MPEFVVAEYLMNKLEISREELANFEAAGILHPVRKNNRTYYSSRDCYDLKGILHFMRSEGLDLKQAEERFAECMAVVLHRTPAVQHA